MEQALPEYEIIFKNDHEHVPYGTRTPEEILSFVEPILQNLVNEGCQVIVVACNTVSTTLAPQLRERFSVPLITLVPMIKPAAAMTKTGVIAVCATPTTLASVRYKELKKEFARGITVLEPDCRDWALMLEDDRLDQEKVSLRIQEVLDKRADVIVLGCTHYHWIEDTIQALARGKATVIQPEPAIVKRLKQVLARLA
jgi:glutamate racemase